MFSRAVSILAIFSVASCAPSAIAQDLGYFSGYGPSYIPCVPPACAAPTCSVPGAYTAASNGPAYGSSGYGRTCGHCGHCSQCGRSKGGKSLNIDLSRTVIKKNSWGFGEEPPAAVMVSSMPVLNIATTAIPINFAPAAGQIDPAIFAAAVSQRLKEQSAPAAAAPARQTCEDPCGDIKQLQTEVQQLKEITVNLTNVVAKLVDQKTP